MGGSSGALRLRRGGRGTSYRVRLTGDLEDELGRRSGRSDTLEWRVPEAPAAGPIPPVLFDRIAANRYESWEAAKDDLGGRFHWGSAAREECELQGENMDAAGVFRPDGDVPSLRSF